MIDRVIELSIRHRGLVCCACVALAILGVYALYHTPVDAIPDLSENQVIVFTEWPGHSPQQIEDQVTYPLSLQLHGVTGVRVVRSSSDVGFSMIHIIFEDGVGAAAARRAVSECLDASALALPSGANPRLGPDAAATGQIFWYILEGPGQDLGRLRAVQDWYVRPQLASVAGVVEVASVGGAPIEYQIGVDPHKLERHGLTASDVARAVRSSNQATSGDVVHKGNAEYVVRAIGWLGARESADGEGMSRIVRDLEKVIIPLPKGGNLSLSEVAHVGLGMQARRGVLEKDGNEVTGGVVLMREGENPLDVTRRIKAKIEELQPGLPSGVRIMPVYERTPLIEGAVGTVASTLIEAILTATVCVLLVLMHFRTSFVVILTLPLTVLTSFAAMWMLRSLSVVNVQTNIMSLAGLAISIGVLVDSSVVMAENVMHHLRLRFGDQPVRGDVRAIVLPACQSVGRPIFFSVIIMLLSFLPVFALGGIAGKMFLPLAFTKSLALAAVALLSVTLVPALCTIFIRGHLRDELASPLVRGVIAVYRPVLTWCLEQPALLAWIVGLTLLLGAAPIGSRPLLLGVLVVAIVACFLAARRGLTRLATTLSLVFVALAAESYIHPIAVERMTPLDEGMVMDMPITVPRASVTETLDDLKARDMVLCRFPEVDMVVGKGGRAETPTDPAPLDMIETMVNFRPREFWPRRKLRESDAEKQAADVLAALVERGVILAPDHRDEAVNAAVMAALPLFDAQMREYAYLRNREFERELGPRLVRVTQERTLGALRDNGAQRQDISNALLLLHTTHGAEAHADHLAMTPSLYDVTAIAQATVHGLAARGVIESHSELLEYRPNPVVHGFLAIHTLMGGSRPTFFTRLLDDVTAARQQAWREHVDQLDGELRDRAAGLYTRLVLQQFLEQSQVVDATVAAGLAERKRVMARLATEMSAPARHHSGEGHRHDNTSSVDPIPTVDSIQNEYSELFARRLLLWQANRSEFAAGGEIDRVMQMPGWTNVWTMPIQNRIDMLSTGVNTTVGVRVLGPHKADVLRAAQDIAAVLKGLPGAASVVLDSGHGKGYLDVIPDRIRAARQGVEVGDITDLVETALAGKVVTTTIEGRERHPVRVRYPRDYRVDEETIARLPVPARGHAPGSAGFVELADVSDIRILEGPATIKSENGILRNYILVNVHGRDATEFVEHAKRTIGEVVTFPSGVHIEWTGQFEQEQRAFNTMLLVVPLVLGLIVLILYLTYHDLGDALLMVLTIPGAVAGGVIGQWLFGYPFSVTVWIGYIACFGMGTATGIVMLVYLREAVARVGGLENISLPVLRQAVLDGAVHRLRPKLLTECTTVLGLAPLLWATGVGAEVIKPMVIPVLGGLLVADEVIDLLLPVLFYWLRRYRWQRLRATPR
jgi:Cu(I)/Ag(I) efflux system membrane protein CusA/SilA